MNKVTASAVGRSNICPNVWSKNILLHIKWKTAGCYTDQHCWDESWMRRVHALHRHRTLWHFLLSSVSQLPAAHTCCGLSFLRVWVLASWEIINLSRNTMQSVIMSTPVPAAPTYQTCNTTLVSVARCPVEGGVLALFANPWVDTDLCYN
jgi:hypothetical protein